ncbi:unnamed protein product [Vitrella brassicaformis CCMP3155]|uniref:Uncharacterized protein n=1 Tax=Vitrella brassicaformis (strain CCMP3155) TaxID=1169540 RepID=A0A0G4FL67_VITBC|nr:unnamed protein product [Vitrella brassicaformis CCMP3155]|eukprot:CEM14655.1 unnamed protein product [Vitrella brassicaformis CCMP3155]
MHLLSTISDADFSALLGSVLCLAARPSPSEASCVLKHLKTHAILTDKDPRFRQECEHAYARLHLMNPHPPNVSPPSPPPSFIYPPSLSATGRATYGGLGGYGFDDEAILPHMLVPRASLSVNDIMGVRAGVTRTMSFSSTSSCSLTTTTAASY